MFFSIALACVPANSTLAQWQFTYAASGAIEDDRIVARGAYLVYERTGSGISLNARMRIDNIRRVTINETTSEIAVQVWAPFHTSVLVLHFTKAQRELAHDVVQRIERLEFSAYLPMQKRAKMPVSSSSVAASPVS